MGRVKWDVIPYHSIGPLLTHTHSKILRSHKITAFHGDGNKCCITCTGMEKKRADIQVEMGMNREGWVRMGWISVSNPGINILLISRTTTTWMIIVYSITPRPQTITGPSKVFGTIQWLLKVVMWSRGGAHMMKLGWSKPHTHSTHPTNLALLNNLEFNVVKVRGAAPAPIWAPAIVWAPRLNLKCNFMPKF